jgi:gliding motility-associated-like protein
MKQLLLKFPSVVCGAAVSMFLFFSQPATAQVATPQHAKFLSELKVQYGDSIDGLNLDALVQKAGERGLTATEARAFISKKARKFVTDKYNLPRAQINTDLQSFRVPNPTPQSACTNMDFENGTFAGWTGFIGDNTVSSLGPLQNISAGIFTVGNNAAINNASARHTIMANPAGNDPYGGFPCVAPGGNYSCRLGNDGQATCNPNYQGEAIEQTFTVGAGNTSFTYQYAVVLNDGGHSAADQPYFRIEMFDQSGNLIPCSQYYVNAGGSIPGFALSSTSACDGSAIYYEPWTTVNVDLSTYVTQNVTIRFTASGCTAAGHFGYAYVDASCNPYQIQQSAAMCQGSTITLSAPIGAASYQWLPGGQTTPDINVSTPGTYTVNMTSVQGCPSQLTITVANNPLPVANFTANAPPCGANFTFNNTSTLSSGTMNYHWDFGEASLTNDTSNVLNPTYNYTAAGTYTVTLTVTSSSGCSDVFTQVVNATTPVTAAFNNTTVCAGTATGFTDTSPSASAWSWDFGDPASGPSNLSTSQNPTHIYTAAGTYTATLTVGTSPCTGTITHVITVNPLPTPSFTYTQVCNDVVVNFTSTSTVAAPSAITGDSWNFGDPASGVNNTSAISNPSHTFSAVGTYTVTLTSTATGGCPFSTTQVISVGAQPVAAFSAPTVCPSASMQFTNTSTASTSYHWDFGDGAVTNDTSNSSNPNWSYPNPGTYTVTLIANPGPCQNTTTVSVTVAPLPVPAFVGTSVCVGSPTVFTDQSTIASGTITGWHWDFGDAALTNDTSNIQNPSYTYAAAGTYTATLTTTSATGCTATNTVSITVNPQPVPSFVYNQACSGSIANFSSTSTIVAPGSITGNAWDFGDPASGANNTSALLNPSHTFSATGTYTVTLVVTTNSGCSQTTTQVITVIPPPTSAFTSNLVCTNSPMQFTNQSLNATQYHWDFGVATVTNDTSNLSNPTYTYTTAGTYTVTLIANPGSCSDTSTITVTVAPGPAVNFVAPAVCLGFQSAFTDQSNISSGTITNWSWNFGVGSLTNDTSNVQNPNYTYTSAGIYTVTLTCTSNNGCVSIQSVPVTVNALPTANFSSTLVCQGTQTPFTDLSIAGTGNITNWSWNFGDASAISTTQNPTHIYPNDSTYNVSLIVTNSAGCIDTVTLPATVASNPVVIFTADTFAGCPTLCVNFQDLSTIASGSITGWSWNFGDGSSSSVLQNPNHCYSQTGTYTVTLTTVSNDACTTTLTIPDMITVYPVPHASFTATPMITTILSPTFDFTDLSTGNPVQWQWNFGDPSTLSDTDNIQNTSYTYSAEYGDSYPVNLMVTNQYGCMDDTTITVIVEPDFAFFIPNAFTPDGDGINDGFYGKGYGIKKYELWIFDRWGNMIFTTNDINEAWDGSVQGSNGEIVQIDVYVWKVALTDVFDKKHKYIGHVSVIK